MNKNKMKETTITNLIIILIFAIGLTSFGIANYRFSQENSRITKDLDNNKIVLAHTQEELIDVQNKLQSEINKTNELAGELSFTKNELDNIKEELDIANMTMADLKDEEYELIYLGEFKMTHYCNESYQHICGSGDGLTATGTNVTPGRTIAVDPTIIPYGTEVYIEGYGWRVAEDCGSAVKGNHIDVAVDLHSEASANGVKYGGVWILVKKSS